MPELAEVEYYRKVWGRGVNHKIRAVEARSDNRVFRGTDTDALRTALTGAVLLSSAAHGKQLVFQFSRQGWLGLHMGMTGHLRVAAADAEPGQHDHLALRQQRQTLIFTDPRQFGRVLFHRGSAAPAWWAGLAAPILSPQFILTAMREFLSRHARAPVKAVLLLQSGFPGIGNWMADEVLWQAGIAPDRPAGKLDADETTKLFRTLQKVCAAALRTVGRGYSDPPGGWLFHRRWERGGICPRDGAALRYEQIAGRTTCWCPSCQRERV